MALRDRSDALHLLALLGLVVLVSAVGFLTIGPLPQDATGHVVSDPTCASCPVQGSAVCAVRAQTAYTYPNACRASCDGARILSNGPCDAIRRAVS